MQKFTTLTGVAAPMDAINVDTDQIIPKLHLRTIKRTGLGKVLFDELRFNTDGSEKPEFILNQEPYRNAQIQDINVEYAAEALDGTLEHCVDTGAWTCAQLARVAAATEDFVDDVDTCDADAIPVLQDFVAELDAAYVEQCIQGASLAAQFGLSFGG